MFWVSVGLIVYFAASVQINLFSNYLLAHYSQALSIKVWAVHAGAYAFMGLCFAGALWLDGRRRPELDLAA